jgi:hypothetical protein
MNKVIPILVLLSLTGCATTQVNSGKTLALAWQGLDAAALSADAAVQAGKLKGSQASTVALDIRKAKAALNTATAAYTATGAVQDPAAQIAIAAAATAEITAILISTK